MVTKLENTPPVDPLSSLKDILEPWLRAVLHQELEKVLNGQVGDRLLTAEQAAEILSTSPDWLYYLSVYPRQGLYNFQALLGIVHSRLLRSEGSCLHSEFML